MEALRASVREALALLGVDRLVFAIHDASFPGAIDADTGRGTPASRESERLLCRVHALGFDAVQLGPQGETDPGVASPYEGSVFARSTLSIPVTHLAGSAWAELLAPSRLAGILAGARAAGAAGGSRVRLAVAERCRAAALDAAYTAFERRRRDPGDAAAARIAGRLKRFAHVQSDWLEREQLYGALCLEHGTPDWRRWSERDARLLDPRPREAAASGRRRAALLRRHGRALERLRFAQLVAHDEHADLRARAHGLGLELFGDLQVGFAARDHWAWRGLLLLGYAMGAPPSRTNPEGQAWGYPVLDPGQYGSRDAPGPAQRLLMRRVEKMFAEFDGLRIDHPHGLVCPWVYASDAADRLQAVRAGARLFSSPDLHDHPALHRLAIADAADLADALPRFADERVARLSQHQVERYAVLFDVLVDAARGAGRPPDALVCEVLSTCPHPLRRVLARHGLGRFRVAQKAGLDDPLDVYRSENALPEDWVMLGNHDTPPIWRCIERWRDAGELEARAADVALKLRLDARSRAALVRAPGPLANALLAELLASPARHVLVFWSDLFGLGEDYNVPGTVGPGNWTLRLPATWERDWQQRSAADHALDVPLACALALRARAPQLGEQPAGLIDRLERGSRALRGREAPGSGDAPASPL